MWVDKILYWAWYGPIIAHPPPPTEKKVLYQKVIYGDLSINIAYGILDDNIFSFYDAGVDQIKGIYDYIIN